MKTAKELGLDLSCVTPDLLEALGIESVSVMRDAVQAYNERSEPTEHIKDWQKLYKASCSASSFQRLVMATVGAFEDCHGDVTRTVAGVIETMLYGFRLATKMIETQELTKSFELLGPIQ